MSNFKYVDTTNNKIILAIVSTTEKYIHIVISVDKFMQAGYAWWHKV
jgi:hypothetical protein